MPISFLAPAERHVAPPEHGKAGDILCYRYSAPPGLVGLYDYLFNLHNAGGKTGGEQVRDRLSAPRLKSGALRI